MTGPSVNPSVYRDPPVFRMPMPPKMKPGQHMWTNKLELDPLIDADERVIVMALLRRFVRYYTRKHDLVRAEAYGALWRKLDATPGHVWRELPFPPRLR